MSDSLPSTIVYRVKGPVARIILNRPDKLNAINAEMVRGLGIALDRAEADPVVRVILLSGEGRAFSAGFDLDMGGDASDTSFVAGALREDFDLIMRFWDSTKPTVAAVHTYCLGSGMELAVACDITLAAQGCRFGAPEVKFGSGIVALILPWIIGVKQAKELLLSGDDRVSAERALSLGLVNRVVPETELEQAALGLAGEIAANDALAVRLTKKAINDTFQHMGMRAALLEALQLDVEIETTETEESRNFNRVLKEQGPRAAIAWRNQNAVAGGGSDHGE
jgi:enoyl-CoA hydratase